MNTDTRFFGQHPFFLLDHQTNDILDVNEKAVEVYGYSRDEFLKMNIMDLGDRTSRRELSDAISNSGKQADRVWIHRTRAGGRRFVQFTFHLFNYRGKPAKMAIAHDVGSLVEGNETNTARFPRIRKYHAYSPLAEIEWDKNFVVKEWSDKAEELLGWNEEEVSGDPGFFERFIHPGEIEIAYKNRDRAIKSGKLNYVVDGRNFTRDGRTLFCEWHNSLLYDDEGNLVSIYSLVHDVSERKEPENLFNALAEKSLVGIYLIQDSVFQYVNPKFADIFDYGREEIEKNMSLYDLVHPSDRHIVRENIQERLSGRKHAIDYGFRCLTRDGHTLHVQVYGSRINYLGRPAIIGTLADVTERKHSLEQYKASVESFQDLFDSISDAIYILNKDAEFIEVNQGTVDMYGYDRETLIGKTPEFLTAPGKVDMDRCHESMKLALNGEKQIMEWWGKRKNGEVFPKEILLNPGTYFGEEVVITIARDITDRHEAEELLRRNEEMFRQLFQNAPIGIVMLDHHYEVRLVNRAFEDMFGYTIDEIEGIDIDRLIVPTGKDGEARELSAKTISGRSAEFITRRMHSDGTLKDVMIYGVPVNVNGRTIAAFGIYVDITERKQAEKRIRRSLREKEVLLAEIHHRVKNNLAVISGLLELQSNNTTSEDAENILRDSQMRIHSIALIHEKLYQSKDLSQISFDVYVQELSEMILKLLSNEESDIRMEVDAEPVTLTINQAIPCGLILNELITNSYKHAFNGSDQGNIKVTVTSNNGEAVLTVEDNGKGLPEDLNLEKPDSLGITLIRTLSKQLNGKYHFRNEKNGMAFDLTFQVSGR